MDKEWISLELHPGSHFECGNGQSSFEKLKQQFWIGIKFRRTGQLFWWNKPKQPEHWLVGDHQQHCKYTVTKIFNY